MSAPGRAIIADYDSGWPGEFLAEKQRLIAAAGPALEAVEHVGSTSVPGLAAKPIIDVMGGVVDVGELDGLVGPFVLAGYEYVPEYEDVLPDRRYFRNPPKGSGEPTRFHLHVVEIGSDFWVEHLSFRDFLRSHPDVADEYAALKPASGLRNFVRPAS